MNELLANIGYFFLLVNLILLLKGFSVNGKAFKIFAFYTLVICVIQIFSNVFYYRHLNNLFLSHFYLILQFILLSFFYHNLMINQKQKQVVWIFTLLGLLALSIQYAINPELFKIFNYFEIFLTSFLITIYATFHFYNLLNEKKQFYYINMGVFIYLFASTVLFLAGNLVTKLSSKYNTLPWTLNSFLYIVYQIFIFYELQLLVLQKKKSGNESYSGK
ncbi:hypothetical protein [Flavobacterium sp. 3HN19-14]|uniref:hypothetical protein n=1 Tax=Flavobacterium sp. 3HN19-14 TaxID=3448133 RepID=UPI003EE08210